MSSERSERDISSGGDGRFLAPAALGMTKAEILAPATLGMTLELETPAC